MGSDLPEHSPADEKSGFLNPAGHLDGPHRKATRSQRPAGVNQIRKEVKSMNKHFFELPKAVKRAVWAALMAEWAKKKAANLTTG